MEYVYAALLLHAAGKEITEESIKGVLQAAGVEADDARVKALVAALEGVNIEEVIEKAAMPLQLQLLQLRLQQKKLQQKRKKRKRRRKKRRSLDLVHSSAELPSIFSFHLYFYVKPFLKFLWHG